MHAAAITSQPPQSVDTDLIDQTLNVAIEAAARRGTSVETWLAHAVAAQIAEDEARRLAIVQAPGPWPGWSARVWIDGMYTVYSSANGCEVWFLPSIHRRWNLTDLRRPWSARTHESPLLDALGRSRTFATAEAAKKALFKSVAASIPRS